MPAPTSRDGMPWWLDWFSKRKWYWKALIILIVLPGGLAYFLITNYPDTVPVLVNRSSLAIIGKPDRVTPLQVAVFLPTVDGNGAANKDGVAQLVGFKAAYDAFEGGVAKKDRHVFHYDFYREPKEDFVAHILDEMKRFYDKEDVRVFVLTMSSAAVRLKESFKEWRSSIEDPDEKPVLVCTVASAPGIADLGNGILRYYVRTEEEAVGLAHYGHWARGLHHAAVLFVTKDMGQHNDIYGEKSRELFTDEFSALGGTVVGAHEVDPAGAHARDQVRLALGKLPAGTGTGVFLAGYGTMFRETLAALAEANFKGVVLCTSTVSEDDWRPSGIDRLDIVSTEPIRKRGVRAANEFERRIVRFMAYETLLKTIECCRYARSTPQFIRLWQRTGEGGPNADLEEEYIANGDTRIRLRPSEFANHQ